MKVIIELEADKDRHYAKINGTTITSNGNTPEDLSRLWARILNQKVYAGNDETLEIYCAEEYYPEWPMSIAEIQEIEKKFSRDMYYEVIDR